MGIGARISDLIGMDPLKYEVIYRVHATQRMFQRRIFENEVIDVLRNGLIIEDYGQDYPFPSILLNAKTGSGRNLHVVASFDTNAKRLYVITVYDPDQAKWTDNFSKRKE